MTLSAVKTAERATELVNAKAIEMGIEKEGYLEIAKTECSCGEAQCVQFVTRTNLISVAFCDSCGDDNAWESDVVVVK